jgi:hypothetical protein
MPNQKMTDAAGAYDPRWFIWTIVFLLVTGISLVSYIVLSDDGSLDSVEFPKKQTVNK